MTYHFTRKTLVTTAGATHEENHDFDAPSTLKAKDRARKHWRKVAEENKTASEIRVELHSRSGWSVSGVNSHKPLAFLAGTKRNPPQLWRKFGEH